jgi:hypothetical protein
VVESQDLHEVVRRVSMMEGVALLCEVLTCISGFSLV